MKFSQFDNLSVRRITRPRLNTPAAVMANAALAVSELARLRGALQEITRENPVNAARIARAALQTEYR